MEASKINQFFIVMVVVAMMIATSSVSAAEAPAPSPTSDATTLFVPTIIASFVAIVFGHLF
ncbi:unnamed protein product [Lathyrus oleraceus]